MLHAVQHFYWVSVNLIMHIIHNHSLSDNRSYTQIFSTTRPYNNKMFVWPADCFGQSFHFSFQSDKTINTQRNLLIITDLEYECVVSGFVSLLWWGLGVFSAIETGGVQGILWEPIYWHLMAGASFQCIRCVVFYPVFYLHLFVTVRCLRYPVVGNLHCDWLQQILNPESYYLTTHPPCYYQGGRFQGWVLTRCRPHTTWWYGG